MKYKVISFDMYQTLVNLDARIPEIWKGILKDEYSEEKGEIGARSIMKNLASAYRQCINPFRNMEEMFMICAKNTVKDTGYNITAETVAYNLMYQHGQAPFYDDSLSTIQKLTEDYTVIISSDSNRLMVDPILAKCKIDKAFISDDIHCYKGETSGRFFEIVLSEMKIKPKEILHIGDSFADIIGAKKAGIDSCWINREYKEWNHSVEPDYIIHNLNEIFDVLNECIIL